MAADVCSPSSRGRFDSPSFSERDSGRLDGLLHRALGQCWTELGEMVHAGELVVTDVTVEA